MSFTDHMGRVDRAVQDHLGGPVTYAPSVGDPVEVIGVFDAAYRLVEDNVEMTMPVVTLMLSDLPAGAVDDRARVTIGGKTYRVREARPDPLGLVVMFALHEVG